jgi:lysophospholipase L1-like esterase
MKSKQLILGSVGVCMGMMTGICEVEAEPFVGIEAVEWGDEWWQQRHADKRTEAKAGDVDVVLLGDSITQYGERQGLYGYYFGNRRVLNLGFSGDRTQHVLWRIQNGALEGLSPKWVVLLVGTNNAGREEPEETLRGIQTILGEIKTRLPETRVLLYAVFPRKPGSADEEVRSLNQQLPALADGKSVLFVDLTPKFLHADGSQKVDLYEPDLLHLSDRGYALWWADMEPRISPALGGGPLPPNPPRAVQSSIRNGPRHQEKLRECAQGGYELVFVGDSITHFWEREGEWGREVWEEYYGHRRALNLGFGGDTTDWVNWRLQNGEVKGLNPKVVVLMIGTNNTHVQQDPAEETLAGIRSNLQTIRHQLPNAKILLLSIFPRGETPEDPLRILNEQVNRELPDLASEISGLTHLNINDAFLDGQGNLSREYMTDLLHPNTRGYQVWAEAMEPTLRELLSEKP